LENLKGRGQGIDRRIILGFILDKQSVRVWNGFSWLRIEFQGVS
jgi:hypothetical protein